MAGAGDCELSTSNYCNSGGEFTCADGFFYDTSRTLTHTANDCSPCTDTNYCVDGAVTACPLGYKCPTYSYAAENHPAQPGYKYDATQTLDDACQSGTYCPGATDTETSCPAGFNMDYASVGVSDTGHFSAMACSPDTPGTGCSDGSYCPEAGNVDPIQCPPGTKGNGNASAGDLDDCTECTGEWCPGGASTATCSTGSYYPERTIFIDEYSCPHGKTSPGGGCNQSTESAGCTDCNANEWCREGETETTLCNAAFQYCPSGALLPEDCAAGQYIDGSLTTCQNCPQGSHCIGYGDKKECLAGYYSVGDGSDENCTPNPEGQSVSTNGILPGTSATPGKWTLEGDIEERDCPYGYTCTGGV